MFSTYFLGDLVCTGNFFFRKFSGNSSRWNWIFPPDLGRVTRARSYFSSPFGSVERLKTLSGLLIWVSGVFPALSSEASEKNIRICMFLLILIRSSQLCMAQMTGENAGGAADQVDQGGFFHRCIGANFIWVSLSMFKKCSPRSIKCTFTK